MDFKAAIFDLDGTLLDSMGLWGAIDERFLTKYGVKEIPSDYMAKVAHLGSYKTAVYTKERFGFTQSPEEMIAEWTEMAADFYASEVTLKDGAYEYLTYLREKGVKLAVATANDEALYIPALRHTGIEKFFSAAATVSEVKRQKGFPDIYELACERLGAKPLETVVFEDIYLGIKGARDGGFMTVGVYDKTSEQDAELMRSTADRYITSFLELLPDTVKTGVL